MGNEKLSPKTKRFRLIKSRFEIKKGRWLQAIFFISISQWEEFEGLYVCNVFCFLFFASFLFSFFLALFGF